MLSDAEIASMSATVARSLDVSLPFYRKTTTPDGYGHSTETWVSQGDAPCNVMKPSATQLQAYAGIIGSQRALMLRAMPTTDLREGDRVTYLSLNWLVHEVLNAESYTFSNNFVITVIV